VSGLLITNARAVTLAGPPGARRGRAGMNDLGVVPRADILVMGQRIVDVVPVGARSRSRTIPPGVRIIDAEGRVVMPGFVDPHTHALWAGDRLDEWDAKRAGTPYLDILKAGGGIMSTVRAVRAATDAQLAAGLASRLATMLASGTTTVEIKSGYGLSPEHELRMLRLIAAAAREGGQLWPTVIATALLGHALDPDDPTLVERTITDTLPRVTREFPRIAVDAFCEDGAWSLADCVRLFDAARRAGHPIRVHTDQFTTKGMTDWAVEHAAASVDHLEASSRETLARVAASSTVACLLPCTGFHTDGRYADGRAIIDGGGAVAIATNCNPGSSPCSSMPMAIALAVRKNGLSPAEAIVGATRNAAALLGLGDRGGLEPGARADLLILRHENERELAHEFGASPVDAVVLGGRVALG
jgi:imidazolonepropionase